MDVKAALTGKDRLAILNSCEFGEDAAKDTYEAVLENDLEHLSIDQKAMITAQLAMLGSDLNKVITMTDALES
jgi:uncharacterized protein (TIGR02284 family)